MNNNNRKDGAAGAKCVQCAIWLRILEKLGIEVQLPERCAPQGAIELQSLYSRKEVIMKLGIAESTYTRWLQQGILKPRIIGRRHFYSEEDLKEAFKESVRKGKR